MENEFHFQQPLPVGGETSAGSVEKAYFSGICAGLSFRSLLSGSSFEPAAQTINPSPKIEPLFSTNDGAAVDTHLYNFFSETAPSSLHHQLPSLLSFEQPHNAAAVNSLAPNPRFVVDPYGKQRRPRRRQPSRLSDKTRCLRKLLPVDDKMDMATVLEETYKYIKFLQAQVSVLQSMPIQSAASAGGNATSAAGGYLPNLNRPQLLQVVTNSPEVQAQLCAEGCCVYAAEQMVLLEKIAERKGVIDQQMMYQYDSYNPNLFLA